MEESKEEKREELIQQKLLKKRLGKFYTENYEHIMQGFELPSLHETHFIEPFVGKGHLLEFLKSYYQTELANLHISFYDLESHVEGTQVRDSIQNPPDYTNAFVITNPPFLALNKTREKDPFHMYGVNDLYKCFLKTIIHRDCVGGLLIIPINFWSSIRKNDILLRKMFLEKYKVKKMNLFEERVFHDTSFMVTSFLFERRQEGDDNFSIPTTIYPSKKEVSFEVSEFTYWMIGGDLYHLPQNEKISVTRVYEKENGEWENPNTRLYLHALDDGIEKRIHLEFVTDREMYIGKESDRSYCSLSIHPPLQDEMQRLLADRFNRYLEKKRTEYHSMFLTNYRESREFARKRISFQLAYEIINYLISHPGE
jgi:hypothetical protein